MKNDRTIRTHTDGKRDPRNVQRDRLRKQARRTKYAVQGRAR